MTQRKIALSIEEAADYTGIGRNTLRKLVEWKKLPVLKVGRKVLIKTDMLELFAKRTDENNQQLEVLTSGNLKQRIATYLLEHADNNNLVSLSMNREELALYLNTTRPSLSRTLLSLQEDGFIHLSSRKSIKILDAEALLYIE